MNLASERLSIAYEPGAVTTQDVEKAVASIGYAATERAPVLEEAEDTEAAERRAEISDLSRRVAFGAIFTAPVLFAVMAENLFGGNWVPGVLTNLWFQLALIAPVMVYTGWPIHRIGWLALSHRSADMNSLITIGTFAAFLYSLVVTLAPGLLPDDMHEVYYEAVGVILTLILLGRLLEARAKAGTGEAIRKLIGLRAKTARIMRDGEEPKLRSTRYGPATSSPCAQGSRSRSTGRSSRAARRSTSRWLRASRSR